MSKSADAGNGQHETAQPVMQMLEILVALT